MDTTSIIFLIVLILSFYFVFNKKPKVTKALNLPPGPPKLPLIGNLHQLAGALPHRALRDLARKYGPIMHIQLGQISAIVVSSPRLAEEVLKTHDIALANRPTVLSAEITMHKNTGIVLSHYGDYWRYVRKISSLQLLSAKKVQSFSKIREQEVNRFMEFIRSSSGEPINIHEKVTEMVNSIIYVSSVGSNSKLQHQLIEFIEEVGRETSGFSLSDLFPEFEFISVITGKRSRLMKLQKTLDKVFDGLLEEHQGRKRDGEAQEEEGILEYLLRMKEEGGLELPITNNNIRAILMVSKLHA